jgi:hypothetical protein
MKVGSNLLARERRHFTTYIYAAVWKCVHALFIID